MSQCGSRWASSIIIDRRWPGVSPAALWKILYSITPEPQRGPEAQLCQTSGCHGGWRMWAQWLRLLFWSDQFNVSGASRAVSNGVPPCFYVHRWPDSLQSGQQQTPHMNQPSRAGLLGWMQQLSFLLALKHQITSDQSSLYWPPLTLALTATFDSYLSCAANPQLHKRSGACRPADPQIASFWKFCIVGLYAHAIC